MPLFCEVPSLGCFVVVTEHELIVPHPLELFYLGPEPLIVNILCMFHLLYGDQFLSIRKQIL